MTVCFDVAWCHWLSRYKVQRLLSATHYATSKHIYGSAAWAARKWSDRTGVVAELSMTREKPMSACRLIWRDNG